MKKTLLICLLYVEPSERFKGKEVYFDITLPFNHLEKHGMFGEKETKK